MTPRAHIVVGMDGTAGSAAALRWAADEASRIGTRLIVVHATGSSASRTERTDEAVTRQRLASWVLQALARTAGTVQVSMHVDDGQPEDVLLSVSTGADLLVLGVNTTDNVGRPVGSVVQRCLERSTCKVATIYGSNHTFRRTFPDRVDARIGTGARL